MLLLASMLITTACGSSDNGDNVDTSSSDTTETTAASEVKGYKYYGDADFGGKKFTVFNTPRDLFEWNCVLVPEDLNGETVNDAMYNRNEVVTDKLNCELVEINTAGWDSMGAQLQTQILADSCEYDAVYMIFNQVHSGLVEGYYQNLSELNNIHLDEPYWNQVMLKETSLRNNNYFATSSTHLMEQEGICCLFFSEAMMDDFGMEYPYQTVKDGKWTLAEFEKYCKQAANLNGDESFDANASGNAVYGGTAMYLVSTRLLYGLGARFVSKDANDEPVIACDNEHFVNACQRLADLFAQKGTFLIASADGNSPEYYLNFFDNQRTLFLSGELAAAQRFRRLEPSFGILPAPKYDEEQEEYNTTTAQQCAVFTIPVTNGAPEDVALLFDALSYESNESVIQEYFGVTVEQKGLRNDESIEMLNILRDTLSIDIGIGYRWTREIEDGIFASVNKGNPNVVSMIESNRAVAENKIALLLETLDNH